MKIDTAEQFQAARFKQSLSLIDVATLMRLPNPETTGYRTVIRWERTTPPAVALAHMETLATGWRPKWWSKKK